MMLIGFLGLTLVALLMVAGLTFTKSLQQRRSSATAQLHEIIFLHD